MILRKVEICNFRKLVDRFVIENISPGLTILAGDNEEGKSTLLEAIRAGFFVKHNASGELPASFQPYNSNLRPEVRIEFELNGEGYKLFKAFCQRPEAELVSASGGFSGLAAEEQLSQLLRFSLPKRMRRDDQREHEGIFGMFWVEQGTAARLEPNTAGRASIVEALQKEVGDVLGGKRGQRLISEVKRIREDLLTSTGRPRGTYAKALQAVSDLQEDSSKVNALIAAHETSIDDLQRYRLKLTRYDRDNTLELAQERMQAARAKHDNIRELARALQDAETALRTTKGTHELATERLLNRTKAIGNLSKAEQALEELLRSVNAERARVSTLSTVRDADEKVVSDATTEREVAETRLRRAGAAERLANLRVELERREQDRAAALSAKSDREASLAIASAVSIDKNAVAEIKRLQEVVTRARARVESVATRLHITVVSGAEVLVDDYPVSGKHECTVTRAAVIRVPGHLDLSVFPGSNVSDPDAQLDSANRALLHALSQHRVQNLADAEEQFEQRNTALNQAESSAKLIAAYAPLGLDALDEQLVGLNAELRQLEAVASDRDRPKDLPGLRILHNQAQLRLEASTQKAEQTRGELSQAVNAETAASAKFSNETIHCAEFRSQLEVARKQVSDAELNANVLEAARKMNAAEVTVTASRAALDAADPQAVERELDMAGAACRQIEADIERLSRKALETESALRVSGGLGLGECKRDLEAQLNAAQSDAERLVRHTRTVDLLWSVLVEAENSAKQQFVRPVTERVRPYLRILLPETELAFDDDIRITGLRRGQIVEPFQSLSVGTQEQLAVLTRLAFADLLREHGQPATVLLDDAIVFADDQRFDLMLHILRKAAEHLQVIVFTCRERDYVGAGAPMIRLCDCRGQAAVATGA